MEIAVPAVMRRAVHNAAKASSALLPACHATLLHAHRAPVSHEEEANLWMNLAHSSSNGFVRAHDVVNLTDLGDDRPRLRVHLPSFNLCSDLARLDTI
jgi:hypothetical protein